MGQGFEELDFEDEEVLHQVLVDCGHELTFRQFHVMFLCVWCGFTQEEVAQSLGISQPAVHYHWGAAIEKLRRLSERYL